MMVVYRSSGSAWSAAAGHVGQSSTSRPAVRQDDATHARPLVQSEGQVTPDSDHHDHRHQLGIHLVDRLSQRHAAGVTSLRIGASVAICVPNVEINRRHRVACPMAVVAVPARTLRACRFCAVSWPVIML